MRAHIYYDTHRHKICSVCKTNFTIAPPRRLDMLGTLSGVDPDMLKMSMLLIATESMSAPLNETIPVVLQVCMHACVYIRMCVYVYVFMCVHIQCDWIYVRVCICIHVCAPESMSAPLNETVPVVLQVCVYVCTDKCACMYMYSCVCTYIATESMSAPLNETIPVVLQVCMYVCVCVHTSVRVCIMYSYVCTGVYVCPPYPHIHTQTYHKRYIYTHTKHIWHRFLSKWGAPIHTHTHNIHGIKNMYTYTHTHTHDTGSHRNEARPLDKQCIPNDGRRVRRRWDVWRGQYTGSKVSMSICLYGYVYYVYMSVWVCVLCLYVCMDMCTMSICLYGYM
jgi:hypothetical protein